MPEAVLTEPPCFVDLDNVFSGDEMARIFQGVIAEGVVAATHLAVSQRSSGATMGVDVAAGAAWVRGDADDLLQPVYHQVSASVVQVAVDAADGANPRIDRVVLRVDDALFDASAQRRGRIEVITGTPAASPVAPAEPDTAITLALVNVATAATVVEDVDITDQRPLAAAGAEWVSTASLRNGAVTAAAVADNTNAGISLAGGWSTTGGGHHSPQAQRDVTNRVYLRGLVTAPNPVTAQVGTVPAGYRPWASETFAVGVRDSGGALDITVPVTVQADGGILVSTTAGLPSSGSQMSLSGITYHTNV